MRSAITRMLAKCKHHDGRTWCGYLTVSEILMVLKMKVAYSLHQEHLVQWAELSVKAGRAGSAWFYFTPSEEFLNLKERS